MTTTTMIATTTVTSTASTTSPHSAALRQAASRHPRALLSLGVLMALSLTTASAGCSNGSSPGPATPRPFSGGVTLTTGGGTSQDPLPLDPGYPKLELSTRFLLEVQGTLEGRIHRATLRIDPLEPLPARYDFPHDAGPLVATYTRDNATVPLGHPKGFIDVKRRDDTSGQGGEAILSLTLSDGGGFPLLELDLVFP